MSTNKLKKQLKSNEFWLFVLISVLVLYLNEISPYVNKYLWDYAKMILTIAATGFILRRYLANFVYKVNDLSDIKLVFSQHKKDINPALSRSEKRMLERKLSKGQQASDDSRIYIISTLVVIAVIISFILLKIFPGIGDKIFKPSVYLILGFITAFYFNYQSFLRSSQKYISKKIKILPALLGFIFSLICLGVILYFKFFGKDYMGVFFIFNLIYILLAYFKGIRIKLSSPVRTVIDLLILSGVVYGLYLLLWSFGPQIINNIILLVLLFWAFLYAFNLNSKYLYALGLIYILATPVLHYVYFDLAEYLTVLTFYLILTGVSSDLLREFIYREE